MAESRGGGDKGKKVLSFAAKKTRRLRQKVYQKVGKSEKTTDDNYTEFVVNFNKQQLAAARLQKELHKYSSSLKAVSQNTKSLLDVWMEYYESQWKGQAEVSEIVKNKILLWEDLLNRVNSDMIEPLQLYMSKFPETKKLVEKRERKIVDYDYAKRVLEETHQKQKVTDLKIQQAEDSYQQAKQAFDDVTDSLYEELPALYDSRIEFYSTFFSNMTSVETKFHEEMAKLDSRYNEIMGELSEEAVSGVHTSKKERVVLPDSNLSSHTPQNNSDEEMESQDTGSVSVENPSNVDPEENLSESFVSAQGDVSESTTPTKSSSEKQSPARTPPSKPVREDFPSDTTADDSKTQDEVTDNGIVVEVPPLKQPPPKPVKPPSMSSEKDLPVAEMENTTQSTDNDKTEGEEVEREVITSDEGKECLNEDQTSTELSRDEGASQKVDNDQPDKEDALYKCVATHAYTGEDEDELCFEKGDTILVIPFENQEDEEEGWKMGIVETTGRKGLFPENFTKPLQ